MIQMPPNYLHLVYTTEAVTARAVAHGVSGYAVFKVLEQGVALWNSLQNLKKKFKARPHLISLPVANNPYVGAKVCTLFYITCYLITKVSNQILGENQAEIVKSIRWIFSALLAHEISNLVGLNSNLSVSVSRFAFSQSAFSYLSSHVDLLAISEYVFKPLNSRLRPGNEFKILPYPCEQNTEKKSDK